ncbi:MAG: hypothetical protein GXY64_04000 [Bacteroidales bacterium]|nr:hypothetical protein [Bacteroidales bacterium]
MKKIILIMVGLLMISSVSFAQDKEALKAQKEAEKAAQKVFKEAKAIYETSIPNEKFGRKETDFEKLAKALPLIEEATKNEYTKGVTDTWKYSADIQYEFYKKLENEVKADPDNETLRSKYVEDGIKLMNSCIQYDELLFKDEKIKPEEKTAIHQRYQIMGVNPAIQILQAAQNASNSDDPEQLKKGAEYAELFLQTLQNTHLMKDFKNENLDDWITYATAFRAQSYLNVEGTPEEKIIEVYEALMKTRYKGIAYQSLSGYFRERDQTKQNKYLKEGVDALAGDDDQADLRANFVAILMQNLYRGGDKEGFKKYAEIMKTDYPDNENAVNAYLLEGEMLFESKDYKGALDIFMKAKEMFSDDRCILMAARSAWMVAQTTGSKKAEMDQAIALFLELEKANPTEPSLWGESLYILYNNTQQTALAAKYKKYYKQ